MSAPMTTYPITKFNMLNFRRQTAANFVSTQRPNKETGKTETYYDIQNDAGYAYKVVTPPCNALFPHLGEGGNEGGKFSKTKQTSKIISNLLREGEDAQFKSERSDFWDFLTNLVDGQLNQMYEADILGATTAIRSKTNKRYGKKKTPEECEEMSLKAFLKAAMTPMKSRDGEENIVIKCGAYMKDLSPRQIRYVQPSGGNYVVMGETPVIRNGALISLAFQIRPFAMSKDKYGITFTLIPDIVVYSTGVGRVSVPMEAIETPNRPYTFSTAEGKEGKVYQNINDSDNRRFMMRPVATEVVFGDLDGTGTMGKISGVTEDNAKYSGLTKENPDDPESVAFFDYATKMVEDAIDYAIADPGLLTKAKADAVEDAKELSTGTGDSYEDCFRTILKDEYFKGPINKRDEDEYRQMKFSQRVFSYGDKTQNTIPLQDADGVDITGSVSIQRGAMIAPVLRPSIYFMPDGGFGMKFDISLDHGIKVISNPESQDDSSGVLYALASEAGKKRSASELEEPDNKRIRIE
jgi:hypothetical protein